MRRVLLTGATGGLGQALVPALLDAGYRVRATGRSSALGERLRRQGADFHAADLCDPDAVSTLSKGVDLVIHAAALSSPWGAPTAFEAINVTATARLLEAARAAGCDAFIHISTPSLYAEPRDRLGLTESCPFAARPANDYVRTKQRAEALVLAANAPGFATVALRPRALVGPADRTLLPRLQRVARKGVFPVFREGRALIDLTDVRDAADAIIAADRNRAAIAGRAFNISGGAPLPVHALLDVAFDALGLAPKRVHLPYGGAAIWAHVLEQVCARLPGRPEPPVTAYTLATLAFSQTFDLTAARRDLGWTPRRAPADAIRWAAAERDSHASL
ncbi:MAG: NAD-dependent epimerase/dehydratase family protein [Caulobacter sp.]|nr:NAD-dependent epimerase/dehydratase family protein [Caulobacter sp.]